jgi:inner membrane protein
VDNVSHTLVGALLGSYLARTRRREDSALDERVRHTLFVPMMAVGSNLPDIDLLYTTIYSGKLEYLLHHRGHTHTILGAIALSLLLWLAAELWLRRKQIVVSGRDRRLVILVALFGPLLHILMDATNSYGVHPFWPLDYRWYYFDTVFIVEPLFWAAAAPLLFLLRSLIARALVGLILIAGVGLGYFTEMVPPLFCIGLAVLMGLLAWAGRRLEPRLALFTGIAVWLSTTLMFSMANRAVTRDVRQLVAATLPHTTLLDHVLTPMPMNPVCWEVMLVQMQGERYAIRRAVVSLLPNIISAASCPRRGLDLETTAPIEPVALPDTAQVLWRGEALMRLDDVRELMVARCDVRALMQFARVPWWVETARTWVVGDLRYDREAELGFAEIEIIGADRCPPHGAPWIPPRQDVIDRAFRNSPRT